MNFQQSSKLGFAVLFAAAVAGATPNVHIDSVVQRWPWNNKVDITYTVGDGQSAGNYMKLVFTATVNGTDYTIDGGTVGASAANGTHTVTWNPPSGIKATGCTMVARLYASAVPSGNDYMILDLSNGSVSYEGAFATQTDSDARYNTDEYKTSKMVFRKVPKWSDKDSLPNAASLPSEGYPRGYSSRPSNNGQAAPTSSLLYNGAQHSTPTYDYYVSIFNVTAAQYDKVYSGTTSSDTRPKSGSGVSWKLLRGDILPATDIANVESSGTGTFIQRLRFLAGNEFAFDLPTEIMFEIALRAGATTKYWWGDTFDSTYCVFNPGSKQNVGTKPANYWGFFDMSGNVLELCRDDNSEPYIHNRLDPFFVASNANATRPIVRGGSHYASSDSSDGQFWASWRGAEVGFENTNGVIGFRLAYIVK